MYYQRYGTPALEIAGSQGKPWPFNAMVGFTGFDGPFSELTAEHRLVPQIVHHPDLTPWAKYCFWRKQMLFTGGGGADIRLFVSFRPSDPAWALRIHLHAFQSFPIPDCLATSILSNTQEGDTSRSGSFSKDFIPNPNGLPRKWTYRVGSWIQFPP